MDTNTINALKRLERAGDASSRATEKLYEAATKVAIAVENIVPVNVKLPRDYKVINIRSNVGSEYFLVKVTLDEEYGCYEEYKYVDGTGEYLHGDFNCKIPSQTRKTTLQFAEDVATGWLDEVAEFLEKRAARAEKAAEVLENAKV